MDSFKDLSSFELNYLMDLLNDRVLSLQKNSFLSSPERDLIKSIVVKCGWTYEYVNSHFLIVPYPKSISNK